MPSKCRALFTLAVMLASPTAAQTRPPDPVRILVLPATRGPAIDAAMAATFGNRIVVALHKAGGSVPTTPKDLDDLVVAQRLGDLVGCDDSTCIAVLAQAIDADQILSTRLVQTHDGLSGFLAVHEVESGRTLRRRELRDVGDIDAAAARQVVAWILGAPDLPLRRPALTLMVSGDIPAAKADTLAGALKTALVANPEVRLTTTDGKPTHDAEVTVTTLEVVRRRHHIRRYLDGTLVATLRVSERGSNTVVFARQVRVTFSARARYSTPDRVVAELCERAARQWSAAIRATVTF